MCCKNKKLIYLVLLVLIFFSSVGFVTGYVVDKNNKQTVITKSTTNKFNKVAAHQNATVDLVSYKDKIYHVFFHSLIVYPELAFDGDYRSDGYNMWMTTVSEFKAILPRLKKNNFILVDYDDIFEKDNQGNIVRKELKLPIGKKPLIISVDDVNYYDYMEKDGFASKLVLDDNGEIATLVKNLSGKYEITYDGDVMPILEQFVADNPDFSYHGARGIIAETGFAGVMGYRITDLTGVDQEKAIADAKGVADVLKASGWKFACHSYTHNQYFNDESLTMEQAQYDTKKWRKYIEPIVGKTNIYISPFGVHFNMTDKRWQYIMSEGFDIYCPVDKLQSIQFADKDVIHSRFDLDGLTMVKYKKYINETFYDVDEVIDPARPRLK